MLILNSRLKKNTYNKGAIGYFKMSPDTFLDLTSHKRRQIIEEEALTLDDYNNFIKKGKLLTMPYLRITAQGDIVAHEGRHRCVAIKEAGESYTYVALIVMNKFYKKKDKTAYPIDFDVRDLPDIWKAQFSDVKRRVSLRSFKYFEDILVSKPKLDRNHTTKSNVVQLSKTAKGTVRVKAALTSIGKVHETIESRY